MTKESSSYFLNVKFINQVLVLLLVFLSLTSPIEGNDNTKHVNGSSSQEVTSQSISSISANPSAVNIETGTGALGEALGFKKDSGIRLGGLWIGDLNYLISGGKKPGRWSGNNLLILSLSIDTEKRKWWKGGLFGAEFLQFNGSSTNKHAGVVQGYNSLPGPPPLNRFELYQLWYRQELFNKKLIVRIGKSIPTLDFNNVLKPLLLKNENLSISATSSLIYTPIFVNSTLLGVIPGFYNSAFGITTTYTPRKSAYFSYGVYDGNLARGKQTGLREPEFNGYYFHIAEAGYSWKLGRYKKPGNVAIGVWYQSGKLSVGKSIEEKGTRGFYLFGTQRLWVRHPGKDNSGMVGFFQLGFNQSKTLPINQYVGTGLTFFGLIPGRLTDSFGFGLAWSRLNPRLFERKTELMLQGYYQMHLFKSTYFLTALSYIPNPGSAKHLPAAWAATMRIISLF